MEKFRAVIFDFFGTLTNQNCAPEDKIIEKWKLYQRRRYNYEEIENIVCGTACPTPFNDFNRTEYFNTLIEMLDLPQNDKTYDNLYEITKSDIEGERLIEGALEIVEYAKGKCEKLGMISDLPNPDYDLSTKWGFADRFNFRHLSYDPDWINNGDYERPLKPDYGVFKRTLHELGTTVEHTLMIGNSLHSDIEPARELGMRAILVDYHNKYPNDKDKINSLEELKKIL